MCGPGVPTRSHGCVARGGCWLQDEACQVNVLRVLRFFKGLEGFRLQEWPQEAIID